MGDVVSVHDEGLLAVSKKARLYLEAMGKLGKLLSLHVFELALELDETVWRKLSLVDSALTGETSNCTH